MYFTYNGISSEEMGLKIIEFPRPGKAEEQTESISIPGRAVELTKPLGMYANTKVTAAFAVIGMSKYRNILKWLSGSGRLIFSDESDKYYNVLMHSALETVRISDRIAEFQISVMFEPFAYAVTSAEVEIGTSYTAVENGGSIYSEPLIVITTEKNDSPILKGDVNFDGKVNAMDASLVLTEYTNIQTGGEPTFTEEQKIAADMNNDGSVTSIDAAQILDVYSSRQGTQNTEKPSQNIIINTNGADLIVGVPDAVVANGFSVTIDCALKLIYYTNGDGAKVNILQYSSFDLPLLHIGTNYMKYTGDNVKSVIVFTRERWL